ncbi:neutral zinc metallopeptidase [Aquidulcibacter sp.]|uniref:KPN_02809 family neutral zinc metallopeptidase n=1 Tax=Aquidulcibacter sp. TaxID=2052990 RepID=UPI0025BA9522|nr:neutral zinc metallopeptidase [Aquidulcibacter sp.]MCA3697847.1 neutral zinc metallopeptidase [Aquidulcibacter sp.]
MRLDDIRRSSNIEDRRGGGGGGLGGGGGGGPRMPLRGRGGIAMIVVVLLLVFFGGGDTMGTLMSILGAGSGAPSQSGGFQADPSPPKGLDQRASSSRSEAETADRVSAVLGSTEDFWTAYFAKSGTTYTPATLVLFDRQTSSPCGTASASTGPFYCPGDKKIYLDMSFFEELDRGLGAKGDFAQAYVIAHEVAHHVQDVTGILPKANRAMRQQGQNKGADSIAVRIELQADCYAGLWAGQSNITQALEPGDIEEALGAASAVGDDRLQKRAQGFAVPDSFTHGTSAQRMTWFKNGFESGDLRGCDTFSARDL